MQQGNEQNAMGKDMAREHYRMLALNLAISLAIMYLVMFAMIWTLREFVQNLNFFYMALMMWAPMGSLMLLTMGMMYKNKKLNAALHVVFTVIFLLSFAAIRQQGLIGDRQFARSMIPHHSGAILMCEQASLSDQELQQLCFAPDGIVSSQKQEVAQLEDILSRLDR